MWKKKKGGISGSAIFNLSIMSPTALCEWNVDHWIAFSKLGAYIAHNASYCMSEVTGSKVTGSSFFRSYPLKCKFPAPIT